VCSLPRVAQASTLCPRGRGAGFCVAPGALAGAPGGRPGVVLCVVAGGQVAGRSVVRYRQTKMPRGKRTTLTVDRPTFEEYFFLGSSGISIARDALDRGIIRTPYESIELVCLVNQLEAEWHYLDTLSELEAHGKDEDYEAAYAQGDRERCDQIILQYIGRERLREMLLEVRSDVRDELQIPEVSRRASRASYLSAAEPENERREEPREKLAPPFNGEPAIIPMARWRFERHFVLDGVPYWIALDAFRQSVIGTPYEMVTMLCDVNMMYSRRLRESAWLAAFERYQSFDEMQVAVQNGTFARDSVEESKGEKFDQMFDALMLEIRTAFGVPETNEIGKAEKYKLWLEAHRSPVN